MTSDSTNERLLNAAAAIAAGFAAVTVWTHISQVAGIAFSTYSLGALAIGALLVWVTWWRGRPEDRLPGGPTLGLAALALLAASLNVLGYRPDLDDVNYIPNIVHYLAHPDTPMSFAVHYVVGENGVAPTSLFQSTILAFEFLQGALCWATGLDFLDTRYFYFPALLSACVPLVWYVALRSVRLAPSAAFAGAAVILGVLPLLGDTFRSYGNYAFPRMQMPKAAVLSLAIPLFLALAVPFLRSPSRGGWLRLFALATACVGLTGSAIPILLILASVIAASHAMAHLPQRLPIRPGILLFTCLGYMVAYAAACLSHARAQLSSDSVLNMAWPTSFEGHAAYMYDAPVPASLITMVVATVAGIWVAHGFLRRFLIWWLIMAGVFVLNPIVGPLVIEYVTSSNIYWRLFYILPFPLTLGIAGGALFHRFPNHRMALAASTIIVLIGAHWVPRAPSIYRGIGEFGLPRYNLESANLRAAEEVAAIAPPGPMLAPLRIAAFLPMVAVDRPQITTRESELLMWVTGLGEDVSVATTRIEASDVFSGHSDDHNALSAVLDRYPVRTVVVRVERYQDPAVSTLLAQHGFGEAGRTAQYVVATRER